VSHTCHAMGCELEVPRSMFMCRKHWFMIPKDMRDMVWALYQPGQEEFKAAVTGNYLDHTHECIQYVAAREKLITRPLFVLVCGDREWRDVKAIGKVLRTLLDPFVLVEGEAKGADRIAAAIAERMMMSVERFPALWDQYGRAAGPMRNRVMLARMMSARQMLHPTRVIAFHDDLANSRGTANMVKLAKGKKFRVTVVKHRSRVDTT